MNEQARVRTGRRNGCRNEAFALAAAAALVGAAVAGAPLIRWQAGGHANGVAGVAVSPNNALFASAGADGTAKVWSAATGRLLHTFRPATSGSVLSVHFSDDSADLIATGTGGGYRWRLSDGAPLTTYCCLETGVAAAIAPDGQTVAVGGSDTGLEEDTLLLTPGGQVIRQLTNLAPNYVFSVLFTPDGAQLITGSGSPFTSGTSGVLRYWRLSDGVETRTIAAHTNRVTALTRAPDGVQFASASLDGTVKIWDLASGAPVRMLPGHVGGASGAAYSPAGGELATCGSDGTIKVWNATTGELSRAIFIGGGAVSSVAWSPDATQLLSGGGGAVFPPGDSTLRSWTAAGAPLRVMTELTSRAEGVAASADGRRVAVGSYFQAKVYNAADGVLVRAIPTTQTMQEVALTSDGEILAAGCYDGTVRVWRVGDGALLYALSGHNSFVQGLAISPDDQYVLASDWDGPVRAWRLDTGALAAEYTTANIGGRALAFSRDGAKFAAAGGNAAQVRAFPGGAVLQTLTGHTAAVNAVGFSGAGDLVITGSADRTARIWNVATGAPLRVLSTPDGQVTTAALARDGRFALTGSAISSAALRIWDAARGAELAAYDQELGAGVTRACFLPDNHGLAFSRADATLVVAENPLARTLGDVNCDRGVDFRDINAFVLALSSAIDYAATYPTCNFQNADCDRNGVVDFRDINAFVALLSGA